jgi:hypothetical protein
MIGSAPFSHLTFYVLFIGKIFLLTLAGAIFFYVDLR